MVPWTSERSNRREWCSKRVVDGISPAAAKIHSEEELFSNVLTIGEGAARRRGLIKSRCSSSLLFPSKTAQPTKVTLCSSRPSPGSELSATLGLPRLPFENNFKLAMGKDPHQIRCRILPVVWTRAKFEKGRGNITTYAKQLNKENFIQGIGIDREDVVHNWWWLVDHVFSKGDAAREQYMSQVGCVLGPYS